MQEAASYFPVYTQGAPTTFVALQVYPGSQKLHNFLRPSMTDGTVEHRVLVFIFGVHPGPVLQEQLRALQPPRRGPAATVVPPGVAPGGMPPRPPGDAHVQRGHAPLLRVGASHVPVPREGGGDPRHVPAARRLVQLMVDAPLLVRVAVPRHEPPPPVLGLDVRLLPRPGRVRPGLAPPLRRAQAGLQDGVHGGVPELPQHAALRHGEPVQGERPHLGHVYPQTPVDAAALDAHQHAYVERGPVGRRGAAVRARAVGLQDCADGSRVPSHFGFSLAPAVIWRRGPLGIEGVGRRQHMQIICGF
mmetsp:Transcript_27058/g.54075  ORF Transcript_27058/g.54075 Transcript_27058/m.54075 type:complete len:303 (-) Transcript_27058:403-1311(-)